MTEYLKCLELLKIINKNNTEEEFYIMEFDNNASLRFSRFIATPNPKIKCLYDYKFKTYEEGYKILEENGFIKWEPKVGEPYWVVDFTLDGMAGKCKYNEDKIDKRMFKTGLAFKTKEEAVAKANEILKFLEENK